jgi:hypothetical protein
MEDVTRCIEHAELMGMASKLNGLYRGSKLGQDRKSHCWLTRVAHAGPEPKTRRDMTEASTTSDQHSDLAK